MGRALHEASPRARAVFAEAGDALGLDVARLCFEGPAESLQLTVNAQPAILTVSVATAAVLEERDIAPGIVSGHSLGEYSALVAAGALGFADAVRLVQRRGQFMQDAVPVGTGAMAAILGLERPVVEEVCREAAASPDEVVEVANVNSPAQIVVAGHKPAVERAVAIAAQRGGKRSVLLPVSAPFHCRLMAPAAERLAEALEGVAVAAPRVPVVRNVDAAPTTTADAVRSHLVRQVTAPVRWSDCVRRMAAAGASTFLEVGPGRVLTGLLKRIDGTLSGLAVEDPAGVDRAAGAVKGGG
jgi:[acyl-carrier-protein] S-malonyltransferase